MKFKAPQGYSTVSPLLRVESIESELEFLHQAFDAEVITRVRDADGGILYAEIRIGDSIVMLDHGRRTQAANRGMVYVWTDNVEETYRRALTSGASHLEEPADQPYGIREAGVKDPEGNTWWIGKEKEKPSTKEIERRLTDQRRARM